MTTSVTKPCFTTQHQTCKTKTNTDFWSETGLALRPTVSDHITGKAFDDTCGRSDSVAECDAQTDGQNSHTNITRQYAGVR